jgi:hypothetical protein
MPGMFRSSLAFVCGLTVVCLLTIVRPRAEQPNLDEATLGWMQAVLDTWEVVSQRELEMVASPLPWIIFYDGTAAWHLQPDTRLIPTHQESPTVLRYMDRAHALIRVPHDGGRLWVPGRAPLDFARHPVATMPYDEDRRSFFVAPLPALFHRLAGPDQARRLDELFLGLACHELTHTLQLAYAMPRIASLRGRYPLPPGFDDNLVQDTFGALEAYQQAYKAERALLGAAILAPNPEDSRTALREALSLSQQRRDRFFLGDKAGYAGLEDVFLSMEGMAMWVQFRTARARASADEDWMQTLVTLSARHDAWSQEHGLALVLLLDRFVPGWQARLLSPDFPSPFAILREAVTPR